MATAVEIIQDRIERLESLIKKARSLAVSALALINNSGFHAPVVAVATVNVALLTGIQNIDGTIGAVNQRVLLANQTNPAFNGIWLQQVGAWTRPADWASGSTRAVGEEVAIQGGTTFARFGGTWRVVVPAIVDAALSTMILFPQKDEGTVAIGGGGSVTQVDRWVLDGVAQALASDGTVGAVAAVNVTVLTVGAGFGQANGTLTMEGTAAHAARFIISNF